MRPQVRWSRPSRQAPEKRRDRCPVFQGNRQLISIADLIPIDPDQLIDDRLIVTARTILKSSNGAFK
jgi:hypothetical protein